MELWRIDKVVNLKDMSFNDGAIYAIFPTDLTQQGKHSKEYPQQNP